MIGHLTDSLVPPRMTELRLEERSTAAGSHWRDHVPLKLADPLTQYSMSTTALDLHR